MKDTDFQRGDDSDRTSSNEYEWGEDVELSIAVIEAVADAADCDPTELEPLGNYIDPDALDTLFGPHGSHDALQGTVSFPLGEYFVEVHSSGKIVVETPEIEP